jgi:pimeloyl-ACP methyl ester carboxylesterase
MMSAELTTKSVELPNGIRLPYAERGDPAGMPVLLLHGYTDSWRSFEPVLPYLPGSLRAIALSQRGHGDADRPAAGYRAADLAADLAAFADALALGPAVVVGNSMGAQVAQRFAIDQPERTLGLMLIGAFTTLRGNPAVRGLWDGVVSALMDPVDPSFVRAFQESMLARPVPAAFLDVFVSESLKVPARVWRAALEGQMEDDATPELGRVAAPTLILWGDKDAIAPREDQEALVAAIPDARLEVYAGAGHAPHWEEPVRVAADLASFAAGLVGRLPGR